MRCAKPIEPFGETLGECRRHVLCDDGRRAVLREPGKQRDQRFDAAGRGADCDHLSIRHIVRGRALMDMNGVLSRRLHEMWAGAGSLLHLQWQVGEDLLFARHRFGDAVDRAYFQGRDRRHRSLVRQVRHHDHGRRAQTHDLGEEFDPVHVRHLDIESHHVGIERLHRIAGFQRVGCLPDDLDIGVAAERMADQASHGARIVDHEDSCLLHFGEAPSFRR